MIVTPMASSRPISLAVIGVTSWLWLFLGLIENPIVSARISNRDQELIRELLPSSKTAQDFAELFFRQKIIPRISEKTLSYTYQGGRLYFSIWKVVHLESLW